MRVYRISTGLSPAALSDQTSVYAIVDLGINPAADSATEKAPGKKKRCRKAFEKEVRDREKHPAKLVPCSSSNCRRNCGHFTVEDRLRIWDEFWKMPYESRRHWLGGKVRMVGVKRRTVRSSCTNSFVRNESRKYFLPKRSSVGDLHVCKSFFLNTLGFRTDSVLTELSKAVKRSPVGLPGERRGHHQPANKLDRSVVESHIKSYKPQISHYSREHAPNVLYLPRELSISQMFENFKQQHPDQKCGVETYRKTLRSMGISFCMPVNEKCPTCLTYEMLNDGVGEEEKKSWQLHNQQAMEARKAYNEDIAVSGLQPSNEACFVVDLQKVVLLPIMPLVKDSFFTSRLVVFNETFANAAATAGGLEKHQCVIWHEAVSGRNAEDITSSIYKIIESLDKPKVTLWMDNCGPQNKNWTLYSSLVAIVNDEEMAVTEINCKYLTAGHTQMLADMVHANIEKRIRRMGNVYDLNDFLTAVNGSMKNVQTVQLELTDMRQWTSGKKQVRGNVPVKLSDIVHAKFCASARKMFYKTRFVADDFKELDFLQKKYQLKIATGRAESRGVAPIKKVAIIDKLCNKMPKMHRSFWQNLPECDSSKDLCSAVQ